MLSLSRICLVGDSLQSYATNCYGHELPNCGIHEIGGSVPNVLCMRFSLAVMCKSNIQWRLLIFDGHRSTTEKADMGHDE